MSEIEFYDHSVVELVWSSFTDDVPVQAARTSTKGDGATSEAGKGLINALVRDRHGVPFEHGGFSFRITAPIFCWRQLVKHRMSSLSEESGRYREMLPRFAVTDFERPLIQTGKAMEYKFTDETPEELRRELHVMECEEAEWLWERYQRKLAMGITKEVARKYLPLALMSTGILTLNGRSLMHFLSLRTSNTGQSHPQYEIEEVAKQIEDIFAKLAPETHAAFDRNGRVAP